MITPPKISVVMPNFNGGAFLETAVQSILAQSYKDFEFIIINDGSTDNSNLILEKYADLDPRIKLISRENKGLVHSLNEAISISRGNYIARMDSDDISHPKRLEYQLDWIKSTQYDIGGTFIELLIHDQTIKKQYPRTHEATRLEMLFGTPVAHGSVIMKTEVAREFLYKPEWNKAEDYDLWERAITANKKIGNLPKYLYQYRLHSNQTSSISISEQNDKTDMIRSRYWHYFVTGITANDTNYTNPILKLRSNKFNSKAYREAFFDLHKIANNLKTEDELLVIKNNAAILAIRAAHKNPLIYFSWLKIRGPKKILSNFYKYKLGLIIFMLWLLNISPNNPNFNKLQNIYLFSKGKWLSRRFGRLMKN
jgi:glycosyltransferase involved in cell wall biosynthesis